MKKLILLFILVLTATSGAWAQKGMQGVGANFSRNYDASGVEVKYQYNLTDIVRLAPSIAFYSNEESCYTQTYLVNIDFFLCKPRRVRPYIFLGGGHGVYFVRDNWYGGHHSTSTTPVTVGLGLDWRLSHSLSLGAGVGYLSDSDDRNKLKISIGLAYNF